MRILEVRRHSMRNKPNEHISREGIALAQLIGSKTGPFNLVVTSPIHRAIETAVAMGFAVDETSQVLSEISTDIINKSRWPAPFDQLQRSMYQHQIIETFANKQANSWRSIVCKINNGEKALIVTHGLFIEFGTIASLSKINTTEYNDPIGYCEGFRLIFEDGKFHAFEILRVSPDNYLVNN